jgi:alpha-tubulin suppressor-like RCC1 family protein
VSPAPRFVATLAIAVASASCAALIGAEFDGAAPRAGDAIDANLGGSEARETPQQDAPADAPGPDGEAAAVERDAHDAATEASIDGCPADREPCAEGCCETVPSFAIGDAFGCALDHAGVTRCWGSSSVGQLGPDLPSDHPRGRPRVVPGLPPARKIVAGAAHACILSTSGEVICWGRAVVTNVPVSGTLQKVPEVTGAIDLVAGNRRTCAILPSKELHCWGVLDTANWYFAPTPIDRGVEQVAVGSLFHCLVADTGQVRCTGECRRGQCGGGAAGALGPNVLGIAAGEEHACAIVALGASAHETRCWGANGADQLGNGAQFADRESPAPIDGPSDFLAIDAYASFTCGIRRDRKVVCWGAYESPGPVRHFPRVIEGLDGARAIDVGGTGACARRDDGIFCFGDNAVGQLGYDGPPDGKIHRIPLP